MKKFLVYVWVLLSGMGGFLLANAPDSADVTIQASKIDTLTLLSDKPLKSPPGAVLRSAVLPGWGQVYNEQYLKGALAFGLNTALIWRYVHYHNRWRDTGNEGDRNRRNATAWYLAATYLLTLIDAYVDAQLYGFDEAMDIASTVPSRDQQLLLFTIRVKL